jgi:DNA replication ATP-dependent helicase Dna2
MKYTKNQELLAELELIANDNQSDLKDKFFVLSKFFYKLVKVITNQEKVAFKNFYTRFKYLLGSMNFLEIENNNINCFRRFIKKGFDPENTTEIALNQGMLILYRILNQLSNNEQKIEFFAQEKYIHNYFISLFPQKTYSAVKNIKVCCDSWGKIFIRNENKCFKLTAYDLDNTEGKIEVYIWQYQNIDLTYIRELLEKDTIIYLKNISYQEDKNIYSTNKDSLIIIEPDFLMDATAIAECFNNNGQNSDIFFLSKLINTVAGSPALKGSIIGYYLDELIRNPRENINNIFENSQKNNALKAALLGRQEMDNIKQSIAEQHLPNIKKLVEQKQTYNTWIEPTFFSHEYGLQGRLDLLNIDKNTEIKNILELKSGKPTNPKYKTAWRNHEMQVVAYNMMLESTYNLQEIGTSKVYYSQCQIIPERNIISEFREKNQLLKIRNEIVSKIYQLADRNFTTFERIKNKGIDNLPPYKLAGLEQFRKFYDSNTITTQYYQELIAFILRELINAKVGERLKEDEEQNKSQNGFASLWLETIKEKEENIIYDLKISTIDQSNGYITFIINNKTNISHSFRQGDLIVIYPKIDYEYKPLKQHIFKGTIKEINYQKLTVSLYNKQTDYFFIEKYNLWALEADIYENNYWSNISCLFELLKCDRYKKALLFGQQKPTIEENFTFNKLENLGLTDHQKQVINDALQTQDYYLLQGPPGTGKTSSFLINYVRELRKKTKEKIFILAFTNKAVKKICESFKKPKNGEKIDYIRFGSKSVEDENLFSEKVKQLNNNDADSWKNIIEDHQVFVSTVSTFQNNYLIFQGFINSFENLIVDEASQLTEADLAGILCLFKKFVLIGDHKQLPAVITQNDEDCKIQNELFKKYNINIKDLRISLFERLFINAQEKDWKHSYGQLTDHFRMHENITRLIQSDYDQELRAYLKKQKIKNFPYILPENNLLFPLTKSRTIFIDTPAENSVKKNSNEAKIATIIVNLFIEYGILKPSEIGIITPFRKQITEIRKYIKEEDQLIIDTVERYQGDERKIIIFSTTIPKPILIPNIKSISEYDKKKTDRKLLVSISRAKEQLIILGNSETLLTDNNYGNLINQIKQQNGFLSQDFAKKIIARLY